MTYLWWSLGILALAMIAGFVSVIPEIRRHQGRGKRHHEVR